MSLKSNKILIQAKSELNKGLIDNALLLYQEAFNLNKFSPEILVGLINCFFLKKDYKNVFIYFEKVEKIINLDNKLLYIKAVSYIETEEYKKAEEILNKIIDKNNQNDILEKLCLINKKTNNYLDLEKNLLKLINLKKDDINLYKELIEIYIKNNHYEKAYNLLEELKKQENQDNEIDFYHLKILFQTGRFDQTISFADELINKNIRINDTYLIKAKALFKMKKYNESLELIENIISNEEIIYYKALNHFYLSNFEKTFYYLNDIYNLFKDNKKYLEYLSETLIKLNKYQEAIDNLEKLILLSNDYKYNINLAECYKNIRNYNKSIEIYENILSQNDIENKEELILKLAESYELNNDYQKAIDKYKSLPINKSINKIIDLEIKRKNFDLALELINRENIDDIDLNIKKAKLYLYINDYDNSINILNSIYPKINDLKRLQEILLIYIELEQIDRAIEINEKILSFNISNQAKKIALFNLSGLYNRKGDIDKSINILENIEDKNFNVVFSLGISYLEKNFLPKALQNLETAYSIDNTNIKLLYYLGFCHYKLNNNDKAINFFEKIKKIDNESSLYHYGLAQIYQSEKNINKAINILNEALEKQIADPEIYILLSELYSQIDMKNKVENTLELGIMHYPNIDEIKILLAKIKLSKKIINDSDEILNSIKNKNNDEFKLLKSLLYYNKAQYIESLENLNHIKNQKTKEILSLKANIYSKLNKTSKAIEYIQDAIILEPKNITLLLNLAEIYENAHQYEDAIWAYQKVIGLEADNFISFKKMADNYFNLKNYYSAIKSYNIAWDISPIDNEILLKIALSYQAINDNSKCIEYLDKYISKEPDYLESYALIAKSYFERGDFNKSEMFFDKYTVLNTNPKPEYLILSGDLQYQKGNFEKAKDLYLKVLKFDKKNFLSLTRIGNLEYELKNYKNAFNYFSELFEYYPNDYESQLLYSVTSYVLGQFGDNEKKIYTKATDYEHRFFDPNWLYKEKKWCKDLILKIQEIIKHI